MNPNAPVTEDDLHACIDRQLTPERQREVEAYLALHPEQAQRVQSYRAQKRELRELFDPILDEAIPQRLAQASRPHTPWYLQRLAAGVAIAVVSGAAGWGLRGALSGEEGSGSLAQQRPTAITMASATGFAQRAAVAHAVFSPDPRRPVEVDAAHEDQLVAWLSKRMGAPMKPPRLQSLGYALEGGRLLPGGTGPVAQFMYRDPVGGKLTLYVSNELGEPANPSAAGGAKPQADTAFRFARQGAVNVFYWVDAPFGYAISAGAEREELARVSAEVYRQLNAR